MKPSTYLETSVIGAYLDNGEPFRRDLTIRWWEHELSEYRAVISPLVTRELERVTEPHRSAYLKLIGGLEQVDLTEEARNLPSQVHRRCFARGGCFIPQNRLSSYLELRTSGERAAAGTDSFIQYRGRVLCSDDCDAGVPGF
jgi:hypothetical protein